MAAVACCAPVAVRTNPKIDFRGVTITRGPSVSALARGPALVHVYTESAGASVYIASAILDDRAPCGDRALTLASARLEPEKRLTVSLRPDQVACLETQRRVPVEVLWHTHRTEPALHELQPAALAKRR